MDQVLDHLGKGRDFSLVGRVPSFHQIPAHEGTVPLTAFCTPTSLYKWMVMSQGSRASSGRLVKVINEVTKGLEQVAMYLDDVIVFHSDPSADVKTIRVLFDRLRKSAITISPSKVRLDTTGADFLGHSISPAGLRSRAEKVSAVILTPMRRDLKQLRSLLGGLLYHRKFLRDMSKRIRTTTALLKKGAIFLCTPNMEVIVRNMLAELATRPVLVFLDWYAVENG